LTHDRSSAAVGSVPNTGKRVNKRARKSPDQGLISKGASSVPPPRKQDAAPRPALRPPRKVTGLL